MNNSINLSDVYDLSKRVEIMKEHGDSKTMFTGTNTNDELVTISIFPNRIVVATYQKNNWIRTNTYWEDGTDEETFSR